jgi:glucosamine 6-phosphate synthetase-like amidotransferase/phosphosugar isomerase protein
LVGEGGFIASDTSPFIEYTKNAIYLEDEEMYSEDKKVLK